MRFRTYNRTSTNRKGERGASLIEILVVMVVLVIGIFTVIRIFPTGFDILQYTANESVGHRLAQSEVEFWRKNAENLPEGIVSITPGPPGFSQFDPDARPNDFTTGTGAYGDDTQYREDIRAKLTDKSEESVDRWVGQNRQRRILGEVTRIPAPTPVNSGGERFASVYSLAYAPIEWPLGGNPADQNVADQYLQIRGNPLFSEDVTELEGEELAVALRNLGRRRFAINYRTGVLYFQHSERPRYFLASYTARFGNDLRTIRSEKVNVPPSQNNPRGGPPAASVKLLEGGGGIEPGTEDIAPRFRYLGSGQPFSNDTNDPFSVYEYKTLANYSLGSQFIAAVAFNPRGYTQQDRGPGGVTIPLRARIDYMAKDWRILHQDVTLPTGQAPYRVRLAMPFLKNAGETVSGDGLETWPGLGTAQQRISALAVDIQNGNLAVNLKDDNENARNGFAADYRTGTLTFPKEMTFYQPNGSSSVEDPGGKTFRIFYSVEGDWGVVPQKAYLQYDVVRTAPTGTLPIGTAMVQGPQTVNGRTQMAILFPTTDEGKAVSYNYTYRTTDNKLKTVYGQEQQLSSEARQTGLDSWYRTISSPTESPKPFITITLPRDAKTNPTLDDFTIDQLRGVSFRAVTVWRDRSRWRQIAVTTHLTREIQ